MDKMHAFAIGAGSRRRCEDERQSLLDQRSALKPVPRGPVMNFKPTRGGFDVCQTRECSGFTSDPESGAWSVESHCGRTHCSPGLASCGPRLHGLTTIGSYSLPKTNEFSNLLSHDHLSPSLMQPFLFPILQASSLSHCHPFLFPIAISPSSPCGQPFLFLMHPTATLFSSPWSPLSLPRTTPSFPTCNASSPSCGLPPFFLLF